MGTSAKRDGHVLLWILLGAAALRAGMHWIGRGEFVGWFNHTYYYYVQTRGLLQDGHLPYPDMPLLFWIYAGVVRIIAWSGVGQDSAIVHTSRLLMCLLPALLAWPCYYLLKRIYAKVWPSARAWSLVIAAGCLPLTMVHMPEMLQKNVLGLLLLTWLMWQTYRLLERFSWRGIGIAALFAAGIVLTHFGTAGAMVLWVAAALGAQAIRRGKVWATIQLGGIGSVVGLVTFLTVAHIDPARSERVIHYLGISFAESWMGKLIGSPDERLAAGITIAIFLSIILLMALAYRRRFLPVKPVDEAFWLTCVVFCSLLIAPFWERSLSARFILFLGPSVVCMVALVDKYTLRKVWQRRIWMTVVLSVIGLLAIGEGTSARMHGKWQQAAHADLHSLGQTHLFGAHDLVLAPTGAEHASNWFLGTKAGVITTLNKSDFQKYRNVYVLNPIEGGLNFRDIAGLKADTPERAYLMMRRNIPRPAGAADIMQTQYLQCFRLGNPPDEWEFDASGKWLSYGRTKFPE